MKLSLENLQVESAPRLGRRQLSPELDRRGTELISTIGILMLIAYAVVTSIFAARSKPFEYDEILTVAVAHQRSLADLLSAWIHAKDSSPLLYSLVEHLSGLCVSNQEIAYRLPSILAFGCILWCLFLFIRRHEGGACAFLCSSLLMLTPLYKVYAIEARSYLLAVACLSIAFVCYQHVPRPAWTVLLGIALISAEAFHYYAFFSFVAFFAAEVAWTVMARKIRWGIWLALAASVLPLLAAWPLLRDLKVFYGNDFWGKPTFRVVELAYDGFFPAFIVRAAPWLGFLFALMLAAVAILAGRFYKSTNRVAGQVRIFVEPLLAVGLLTVPFVAFAAAKIANGTLTGRYLISMVLGVALCASYALRFLKRRELIVSVLVFLILVGIGRQERLFWQGEHKDVASASPSAALTVLWKSAGQPDLPVVISRGITFLETVYYVPSDLARHVVGIVDAPNAVKYSGTDSLDRQLIVLPCCLDIQVQEFSNFVTGHSSFLMYSDSNFDWWPVRLRKEGYSLDLVGSDKSHNLFRVTRSPGSL